MRLNAGEKGPAFERDRHKPLERTVSLDYPLNILGIIPHINMKGLNDSEKNPWRGKIQYWISRLKHASNMPDKNGFLFSALTARKSESKNISSFSELITIVSLL